MSEYLIPTQAAQSEFVEKRSRFIGQIQPVRTEAEARAFLEEVRKKHYDARHNCWCWLLGSGTVRYSDDGEPQGTAGQPMLGVFEKEGVTDLCCVVTRYFGGTLLGAGGLTRAYARAAKDALDAAGISALRSWTRLGLACPYALYQRVCRETEARDGRVEDAQYGADITMRLLLPRDKGDDFISKLTDLTAGALVPEVLGEALEPAPVRAPKL